jgi:DNA-binding NarL/FixJ family response regulator
MIRVLVVDDHPAMRAGLRAVIDTEPGIVFAAQSDGEQQSLLGELQQTNVDLVLLDYHLPHSDGLQLCYRIKHEPAPPRVLLYSAYASPTLALPAHLAQADGLVHKGIGARELFEAIRRVHRGERLLAPLSKAVLEEAYGKLDTDSLPLVAMLLHGCTEQEASEALRMDPPAVRHAVQQILARLALQIPTSAYPATGGRG